MHAYPCWRGIVWLLALFVVICAAGCSGGSGGGPGGGDSTIPITGEYAVTVVTQSDTCDLGGGTLDTPMFVDETGATSAQVDLPVGGAGGECNRLEFARIDNTLERFESSDQQIGPCPVQVDVTTVLDFVDGVPVTVSGGETVTITPLDAQACEDVISNCSLELTLSGARCPACFSCVDPGPATAATGWGALARAAGLFAVDGPRDVSPE